MQKIIDSHLHIFNLDKFQLPWLDDFPTINRNVPVDAYIADWKGKGDYEVIGAVHMETDVAPQFREAENEFIIGLANDPDHLVVASIVSADMQSPDFADYIGQYIGTPVKGVRQVLQVPSSPKGACLTPQFIENVRHLGELGMSFDVVIRTEELGDAVELAKQCPDTTIVLDHMGFLDPFAWNDPARADYVKQWKDNITAFGALPNTAGKVSGMNSGDPAVIAEPINFYLNAFEGGKRCIYASNYPVVELDIPLDTWIKGLMEVVKDRPQEFKDALFMENVKRIYKL